LYHCVLNHPQAVHHKGWEAKYFIHNNQS
jgi:hypothetical protein